MTVAELGEQLRTMYNGAPQRETAVMVHLFGIKYAIQIRESGASPRDIVIAAGISESYGTEVNKGINLAKYVRVRESAP